MADNVIPFIAPPIISPQDRARIRDLTAKGHLVGGFAANASMPAPLCQLYADAMLRRPLLSAPGMASADNSFAAYAPDPDADYRAGYGDGYRTGLIHGRADPAGAQGLVRWMRPRRRGGGGRFVTGRGFLIGFGLLVAVALLLEAFG